MLFRAISELKDALDVNAKLAAPAHFIPELPGWVDRSVFIDSCGPLHIFHNDFHSQALSKIVRGHGQDRLDVASMLRSGLLDPHLLRELFEKIEPRLIRYPAIDPESLRRSLDEALAPRS